MRTVPRPRWNVANGGLTADVPDTESHAGIGKKKKEEKKQHHAAACGCQGVWKVGSLAGQMSGGPGSPTGQLSNMHAKMPISPMDRFGPVDDYVR